LLCVIKDLLNSYLILLLAYVFAVPSKNGIKREISAEFGEIKPIICVTTSQLTTNNGELIFGEKGYFSSLKNIG